MKLYCLGPKNTYSDLIAQKLEGWNQEIEYLNSFADIVDQVCNEEGAYGLVVVENSITSSIHSTIDQLFAKKIHVVAEALLNIKLHLIAREDSTLDLVKTVYSKKEALLQCQDFIRKNNLATVEVESTAAGSNLAIKDLSAAVIGGKQIATGELKIIAANIGDQQNNKTRFIVISQSAKDSETKDANKLTVILTLPHSKGSLAKLLTEIANLGGNLSKVESRPIPGSEWEYRFWLDIEFEPRDKAKIIEGIRQNSLEYSILGVYKRGKTYES